MFNPYEFERIDWDDEDEEDGNLAHCLAHGVDEAVVDEVLSEHPVEVKMKLKSADFAIVGPDTAGQFWTLLFDRSDKRQEWLRPITGWQAKQMEVAKWQQATGQPRRRRWLIQEGLSARDAKLRRRQRVRSWKTRHERSRRQTSVRCCLFDWSRDSFASSEA